MTAQLVALCLDANDPMRLARFWAEALRWNIDDETHDGICLVPTDDTRFLILFLAVPGQKSGQNRLHLDLTTTSIDDQNETVARLVELGARHIDIGQDPDEGHVVLADPEGNEFCIIEPDNNFLADCGRLGSITCDGTQAVGYFWSEALGWPLVWDQDEETAIRLPDGTGPMITWGGPPLMSKIAKNRLHLDIAPPAGASQRVEVVNGQVAVPAGGHGKSPPLGLRFRCSTCRLAPSSLGRFPVVPSAGATADGSGQSGSSGVRWSAPRPA